MKIELRPTRMRLITVLLTLGVSAGQNRAIRPDIPRVWDERALKEMELPVVVPEYSPRPVSGEYYYKIPARTIYKSYPIYAPGRGPSGYLEKLRSLDPEIAFKPSELRSNSDWIRAGELVFEAPTQLEDEAAVFSKAIADPAWYSHTGVRLTTEGIMPYARYVIRTKGEVEVGSLSCANCHMKVTDAGVKVLAGPGDFPLDPTNAFASGVWACRKRGATSLRCSQRLGYVNGSAKWKRTRWAPSLGFGIRSQQGSWRGIDRVHFFRRLFRTCMEFASGDIWINPG